MAAAGSTSRLTGQSHETIIHLSGKSETPAFHTASIAPLCNAGGEFPQGANTNKGNTVTSYN